jgi:adenosylhomocysteine nucleosidase
MNPERGTPPGSGAVHPQARTRSAGTPTPAPHSAEREGPSALRAPRSEFPCVLFALRRESHFFRRALPPHWIRSVPCPAWWAGAEQHALCVETGMGAAAVERALAWVLSWPVRPTCVLFAGFAGALAPGLAVGDLVQASEVRDETGRTWPVSRTALPRELEGSASGKPPLPSSSRRNGAQRSVPVSGALLTVSELASGPDAKRRLAERHGALAVDMESATAARLCAEADLPFLAVRAISDDARTELSAGLARVLAGGLVSVSRLMAHLALRPWGVVELLRLAWDTSRAARTLSEALVAWLAEAGVRRAPGSD